MRFHLSYRLETDVSSMIPWPTSRLHLRPGRRQISVASAAQLGKNTTNILTLPNVAEMLFYIKRKRYKYSVSDYSI